jgi:hypothetical protein
MSQIDILNTMQSEEVKSRLLDAGIIHLRLF